MGTGTGWAVTRAGLGTPAAGCGADHRSRRDPRNSPAVHVRLPFLVLLVAESAARRGSAAGLSGMRERLALYGGALRIDSDAESGTWLRASVPAAGSKPTFANNSL